MIHGFSDSKSLKWSSPSFQSSLSPHLHRGTQAGLPLTFRITFPSPPRPSRSPEATTPDSRSDGLNYYLFLFGFATITRRYRTHRADSAGSRCPTIYATYQPNTPVLYLVCPWPVLIGAGGGLGCWDRGPLAFNLTPALEGAS